MCTGVYIYSVIINHINICVHSKTTLNHSKRKAWCIKKIVIGNLENTIHEMHVTLLHFFKYNVSLRVILIL